MFSGYSKKARISQEVEKESLFVDIELMDDEIRRHRPLEILQEENERLLMEIRWLHEKLKEDTKESRQYLRLRDITKLT